MPQKSIMEYFKKEVPDVDRPSSSSTQPCDKRKCITPSSWQCPGCGDTFARKDHCSRHMVLCCGSALYTCSFCGASFAQAWTLARHSQACSKGVALLQEGVYRDRLVLQKVEWSDTKRVLRSETVCCLCNAVLTSLEELSSHEAEHLPAAYAKGNEGADGNSESMRNEQHISEVIELIHLEE